MLSRWKPIKMTCWNFASSPRPAFLRTRTAYTPQIINLKGGWRITWELMLNNCTSCGFRLRRGVSLRLFLARRRKPHSHT